MKGLANIREATIQDDTFSELTRTVRQRWPDLKSNILLSVQTFWPYRDKLVQDNGNMFKGTKVAIPRSMQTFMLQLMHASHQGPRVCVWWAQDVMFWPGMANEI